MSHEPTASPTRLAGCVLAGLLLSAAAPVPADTLGPDTGIRWAYTPAEISRLCQHTLEDARAQIKAITARAPARTAFEEGLGAIESTSAQVYEALSAPINLAQFAVARDVRDAGTSCNNDYVAWSVEVSADPAVYALAQSATRMAQTGEERQLAKIYVETGRRSGAALLPPQRAEAQRLLNEISRLGIEFSRELGEDQSTVQLSAAETRSLPAALAGGLTTSASGATLTVNESTLGPFLDNEPVRDARQRFTEAYYRRGGRQNIERLTKAIALRQQLAALLGYPTWAAYQLDVKMAKTPERAEALVLDVDRALLPKAREEIRELAQLKRAGGDTTPFLNWDYRYYEQQLIKARYAIDKEEVRRYFPIDHVVPAVLELYAKLLGVRFVELPKPDAWAPRVTEYAIYDAASGAAIGWFYLDLYPREGKYDHFAAFPLRPGRQLPGGGYQKPVAAIIGNWPIPGTGRPTLLSHEELVTFFHEFGHIMHETLATNRYASLYGPNTRLDFPEAPSQMLENWMWQPEILKKISAHVDTGAPLPDELVRKMIALKNVDAGVKWCRQAFVADFDLKVHMATGKVDPQAVWFALMPQLYVFPEVPGTYPAASFDHIMGGLDAGYYGYLWSRVFAQDMFTVFQHDGLEGGAAGKRYREQLLAPGGSIEPEVLLRNFLGRPVSNAPFYLDLGIHAPQARPPS